MTRGHVVIAPDKFKGSLPAIDVAGALARGIRSEDPHVELVLRPVADGGDGTVESALAAGFDLVEVTVGGPDGPLTTCYARRAGTAVIELADACGLVRTGARLDPLGASSRALGEVMLHAVDDGCTRLVVGIGGSASTDGGAGMVQALGAVIRDARGQVVPDGGGPLSSAASLDLGALDARLSDVDIVFACDVDNPLLGRTGAAVVYGAQKGADQAQIALLDDSLRRWARVVADATGRDLRDAPGAGAAGGVGFAAISILDARLASGIETMLDLHAFDEVLRGAQLVITGEGRLDSQTLHGKAPHGVAAAARHAGVPTVLVCGRDDLPVGQPGLDGVSEIWSLADLEPDLERSIAHALDLLEEVGRRIGAHHLTTNQVGT